MADYRYERLSGLDSSFLALEGRDTPMHVASTAIFDAAPLTLAHGGIDIERITAYIAARLHRIPRYRERLAYIPIEAHPVWVDDERFNLTYHLRHTSLPKPGNERQLKRLAARIMSQQLDRGKPLWETWVIEGLDGGRFALLSKVHHCMIDGVSGADLLSVLLSAAPETAADAPVGWIPRPAPGQLELLRDEVAARFRGPLSLAARLMREPGAVAREARDGIGAVIEAVGGSLRLPDLTPLNQPIGPHRRFDWLAMELSAIREVRARLGGSVNDVVLATVAGAVRQFLWQRNASVEHLAFRVFVPVSVRSAAERGTLGNRVAGWMVDLPIAERDPGVRLAEVRRITADLKNSRQSRGMEILSGLTEWTGSTVLSVAERLASRATPFNMVVTNIAGPPVPLYLLGARMLEIYPLVPLFVNQGLGIALFSNAGKLFWGFNADWDALPDLHDFVAAVEASFGELCRVEAPVRADPSRRRQGPRRRLGKAAGGASAAASPPPTSRSE
jgi:diacylglycerol O-acyltransferase